MIYYIMEKNNKNKIRVKEVRGHELENNLFYYRDNKGNIVVSDSLTGRKVFAIHYKKEKALKKLNEMMNKIEKIRKENIYKKYIDQFNKLKERRN